ncbi:MAG: DEAD/DEAH box helicase family protein [Peptococcaceae bacterium]|nr:DEAD/DEAH box helicase family protein [Peptococcaceae bacterium]
MLFYILRDKDGGIYASPFPALDMLCNGAEAYVYPGLPLQVLNDFQCKEQGLLSESEIIKKLAVSLRKNKCLLTEQLRWLKLNAFSPYYDDCLRFARKEELLNGLLTIIQGRQVTENEFFSLAKVLKVSVTELAILLHLTVIKGYGEWVPGLSRRNNSWQCERCGNKDCYQVWPSYYGHTATCLSCKSLGPLSSLQVIYRSLEGTLQREKEKKAGTTPSTLSEQDWQFTPAQCSAAADLQLFARDPVAKEALVWAACGAGKTEITFPVIEQYLEQSQSVLYAAPRRDVVHDIQPRLEKYFNSCKVKVMSGLSPPDWTACPLTVATTHQVLKFSRAFDLIILDEMDAYPYAGDQVLEYGLKQALKRTGKIIYLSATPSASILAKVGRQECFLTRLPARFHGYPLPVPEFLKLKPPKISEPMIVEGRILGSRSLLAIGDYLRKLLLDGQLFVFVPTVSLVNTWVQVLSLLFKDKKITGSWGSDPDRKRNVASFTSGKSDVIVCTSILERGITVHKAQAVVLYADHALYDVRALVQMAGRVGRTAACPQGRVLFIAGKQSKEITAAIKWIEDQNELAAQGGFLHGR